MNNITVSKAISKGHLFVTAPVFIVMFGTIGAALYLGVEKLLPFWIVPASFLIGPILGYLYWSYSITKWRLWAFENVRNVHELNRRSISQNLIYKEGSFFEKTEFRSADDKMKWKLLKNKFNKEDHFIDDSSIPSETTIYYSKGKNFLEMLVGVALLGFGIYKLIFESNYIFGLIALVYGGYIAFKEFKQATNSEPQIILNNNGVKTVNTEFYSWDEISRAEVVKEGYGKYTRYSFTYSHPEGRELIDINDFNTSFNKLDKLIFTYGSRYKIEKNSTNIG